MAGSIDELVPSVLCSDYNYCEQLADLLVNETDLDELWLLCTENLPASPTSPTPPERVYSHLDYDSEHLQERIRPACGRGYHPGPYSHVDATWPAMDSSMFQPYPMPTINHNNNATSVALQSPSTLAAPPLTHTELSPYGQSVVTGSAYHTFMPQQPLITPYPPPPAPFNIERTLCPSVALQLPSLAAPPLTHTELSPYGQSGSAYHTFMPQQPLITPYQV